MNAVVEKEVVAPVSNIVELQNGEKVNFGRSGKALASYDVPSRTLTFKVVTGEVISYTLTEEEQAGLTDNQIEHILYARQEKIKSTLAPVKAVLTEAEVAEGKLNVAAKIKKEILDLSEGKFVTRAASAGSIELDAWLKAFALVNATGKVIIDAAGSTFDVPMVKWEHTSTLAFDGLKPEWADLSNVHVVAEVLEAWKALSRDAKAEQKRNNTFISTQASLIEQGVVKV